MNARAFALGLLLLALSCGSASGGATLELRSCDLPGVSSARCGQYRVPENRAAEGGRILDLNVVVIPARERGAAPDPIFFLHGGPGGAAAAVSSVFERSPWRERRDIVLIDQRGTGESNPLNCKPDDVKDLLYDVATFGVSGADACRKRFDANLAMYTTTVAVEDLEEIRLALGAPPVNLIGGSYGTRVALEYLRRHPTSVRTATLRGVAPPSFSIPSWFDSDSMLALYRVLDDCAEDARCKAAYPRLRDEFEEVNRRLAEKPGTARIRDPLKRRTVAVEVSRELFVGSLHYALYVNSTASRIPRWIHEAHRGDFDDLIDSTARFMAAMSSQLSMGLFLTVTCAEDAPFYDPAEVVAGARETLLRGVFSVTLSETCRRWSVPPVPETFKRPVRSDVPVLLISGEVDPVTPPRVAEEAARHLERSLHVVLPETGHSDLAPGCAADLVGRFLDAGMVEGLETGCVSRVRRPAFDVDDS